LPSTIFLPDELEQKDMEYKDEETDGKPEDGR
jgi:hypothetical protein